MQGPLLIRHLFPKGALIIGEVGFEDKGPLIQRALLVLLEQRPLDQGAFICWWGGNKTLCRG